MSTSKGRELPTQTENTPVPVETKKKAGEMRGDSSGTATSSTPNVGVGRAPGVPPHREDPVQEDPFPVGHPGHAVWLKATRQAELELFRFEQEMLERRTQTPEEDKDWFIELVFGKYQIWAKRGLCVVRNRADTRAYETWLETYLQSWLRLAEEQRPELVSELKSQLLRAAKYWNGNAQESVGALQSTITEVPVGAGRGGLRAGELTSLRHGTEQDNPIGVEKPASDPSTNEAVASPDGVMAAPGAERETQPNWENPAMNRPQLPSSVLRRSRKDREIEDVRILVRQMLEEDATHQQVCQRLKDKARPPHAAWRHLSWDKAFMDSRYRGAVRKWLSKNCRP